MPAEVPQPDGLTLCARYQAGGPDAGVGGDWYDVFDTADGSTAFVVGDVMGKGVEAAVLMGEIRTAVRAYALTDPRPSTVLPLLDRFVSARRDLDHLVTVVYGLVSPDRSLLTWSIAGHPPPIIVRPDAPPVVLDEPRGPALGIGASEWRESTLRLRARDAVFAFTDGLVHGRQVDVFAGIETLLAHFGELPRRRRTPRHLCTEARAAMDGIAGWDDVTMLAVGTTVGAGRQAAHRLDNEPTAPGLARRFLRRLLNDWDVDDDAVETAQLCVSELVTNAVLHGGPVSDLVVELDDEVVTVLVTDSGGKDQVERALGEDTELVSGRGLALVEGMTSTWGSERTPQGTTVWFELDVTANVPDAQTPPAVTTASVRKPASRPSRMP
jgi:anti-sigma regulatory factor (Ser/Thr protein kinase)